MTKKVYPPRLSFTDRFTLFAGVVLPAIAITFEASTHICATMHFDPIPTVWHLILVIFVPLAQLQVWFTIRRGVPDRLMLAGFLNAIAIGISIFYSIIYLPTLPLALLTVLIAVGLLPLSPILSLIAALTMRQQLRQIAAAAPPTLALSVKALLAALALTFVLIGAVELPATITRYGLQLASSSSVEARSNGIRLLRNYGSREHMLRSCYTGTGGATDILGDLLSIPNPVGITEAREIYYRVTGETFDMTPPPRRVSGRLIAQDYVDFEPDQDGTRIGGKLNGLTLLHSALDGSIDADGGVGFLEWTFAFRNDSDWAKEARAEIQLPPGAVVSRATLWVGDEERQAVFSNRQELDAFSPTDSRKRDNLLVTTAGRDRILVQAFPVPRYGGELKLRLGITVPLVLQSRHLARFLLPHFESRNFRIPDRLNHSIWVEAKRSLGSSYGGLYYSPAVDGRFIVSGHVSNKDLSRPEMALVVSRLDRESGTWSHNPFESDGTIVKQWIEERTPAHVRRIVLVVDTSESMAQWEPDITAALDALPHEMDVKLVLADPDWLNETQRKYEDTITGISSIASRLELTPFRGGADNAPALRRAWDLAAEAPGNNAIIWIHNPQLVKLESVDELRKRWQGRPYGPLLYSVQTSPGSDAITKALDGINEVKSVIRLGTLRSDLEQLFVQASGQGATFEFVRSMKLSELPEATEGYEASDHLAELWASDEVTRILDARDQQLNNSAASVAMHYQIVTPLSDAAVSPSTADSQPHFEARPIDMEMTSIMPPEFETLLVGVVLFIVGVIYIRYYRVRGFC